MQALPPHGGVWFAVRAVATAWSRRAQTTKGKYMQINQRLLVVGAAALLSACTSVATISSVQSGTVVSLREHAVTTPGQQPLKSTSFTNFEFKAIEPGNDQPLYGVLPLEFRGGHLALDILFFAPGAFLNLRTAY